MRKYEVVLLPCELFGMGGNKLTQCGSHVMEKSAIKWRNMEIKEVLPDHKSMNEWKKFQVWLMEQKPSNVCDFQEDWIAEWLISHNNDKFCIRTEENAFESNVKRSENSRQTTHQC